jgi:hypothetical protein
MSNTIDQEKVERRKAWRKAHYQKNKEKYLLEAKKWNAANKEKVKNRVVKPSTLEARKRARANWKLRNKERVRLAELKRRKRRTAERICADPAYRAMLICRSRMNTAIRRHAKCFPKSSRTIDLIGCSYQDIVKHIQGQFREGMSWDNHGRHGWHIDHIIPCASFNLSIESEQRKCFHYSNLRPLWAIENLMKGDKLA